MKRLLMPLFTAFSWSTWLLSALVACDGDGHPETPFLVGGELTVFDRSSNAYSTPAPTLTPDELDRHRAGDAAFEARFVTSPAPVNPGLGPTFNHTSCGGCHPRDGRGLALVGGPPVLSPLLVRVSLAEGETDIPGAPIPVPGLGTQIQDHGVYGVNPEATVDLTWEEVPGVYADGTPFVLRAPIVELTWADGTPIGPEVLRSPRIPSPVFGLGLIEAIPEAAILALADPDDDDGDGISGRPNMVWDPRQGTRRLGRFGWKANTVDLTLQVAGAYFNDMGITTPLNPEPDSTYELDADIVADAVFYVQTLGVPAPAAAPGAESEVRRGGVLFRSFACASCHVDAVDTGPHAEPILAGQRIAPYTDLLLHDMGDGLADGRPDWDATGREWRTAPLWGIGLTETVLPGATYLHDGRARTLAEAILWHGGEAESSRELFRNASRRDRDALLSFLQSL